MKQKVLFVALLLLATVSMKNVQAQLFSAISPSGHTIYYQWNYDDSYYSGGNTQYNSVMVVSHNAIENGEGYTRILGDTSLHGAVIIPDSVMYGSRKYAVTRINSFMASNITNLTIPNTVKKIDGDALSECGFTTLTIPVGVTSLGGAVALSCPNLTTVYYNARRAIVPSDFSGSQFSWTVRNIVIGDSVEYIPKFFCSNRDSLRTVTMLGHVKQIDEHAFFGCKNLRTIVIPSSVEQIGEDAFAICENLDTVYYTAINCTTRYPRYDGPFRSTNINMLFIGDSVQRIHLYTFDTVQTAISKNATPPVVDCYARDYSGSNSYSYVTNAKIFTGNTTNVIVPCGFADLYQEQNAWNQNTISDDCVTVTATSSDTSLGIVVGGTTCSPNTPITLYALPSAGNTFVSWSDSNTDNPRNIVSISEDVTFTAIFSTKDTIIIHDTTTVVDTLSLTEYVPVHDTTYVDVPYAVHDTTYINVHDTIYIDVPYAVHDTTIIHDTTYVDVPYAVHDTTIQKDTVYLPVYVHDTTTVQDTTYLPVYIHDTSYVSVHDTTIIHDTTYIDVPYAVHDTTVVVDTLTLTEYVDVFVHDTTYINVHDTTIVVDTVTVTEYVDVFVHDTTFIDVPYAVHDTTIFHDTTYIDVPYAVHDTTIVTDTLTLTEYVDVFVHDTTYINVHDTTYIDVPYAVHDTTVVVDTLTVTEYVDVFVHDTTYINVHDTTYIDVPYAVHDTTIVTDTLTLTEYVDVIVHDTTYITLTDTVTNTIYDTITNTVYDTVTNTVYDTTVVFSTDTLWLHDTVFVHDTVYIYDTVYVGVDDVEAISARIYTSGGQIVVDGTQGNTVWLYDVNGRMLATRQDEQSPLHFDVPASGAYLVKIGRHPARKIVVIR